ncbi:MAG: DUF2281 domain-containing protein [Leptolyngbyaceae cyanobacterium SL_7_1]|nr:DUF2281 domain-containing protein [Leptolyngbyaceae cyanobacterium SL_7_1]
MTTEQILLEKWRSLPPDKQQEVVDFVEFLQNRQSPEAIVRQDHGSLLGTQLQQIREQIVTSGTPLLSDEEVDRELAERRGGYQELG